MAAGDVNGDGTPDIITGTYGFQSTVRVFSGKNPVGGVPTLLYGLLPFGANLTGGVFVAAGDVNGDGKADIIVGMDPGISRVVVINGANPFGPLLFDQLVFADQPGYNGGVRVGAVDANGDGLADVIVGAGPTRGPQVDLYNVLTGQRLLNTLAYDATFAGGVWVAGGV